MCMFEMVATDLKTTVHVYTRMSVHSLQDT